MKTYNTDEVRVIADMTNDECLRWSNAFSNHYSQLMKAESLRVMEMLRKDYPETKIMKYPTSVCKSGRYVITKTVRIKVGHDNMDAVRSIIEDLNDNGLAFWFHSMYHAGFIRDYDPSPSYDWCIKFARVKEE